MKTISLDILRKAELPTHQSHAILKVLELEMSSVHQIYATKEDLKASTHALELKIAELQANLMRWTLTCLLGQTAVLAGLGYFFLAHFSK